MLVQADEAVRAEPNPGPMVPTPMTIAAAKTVIIPRDIVKNDVKIS